MNININYSVYRTNTVSTVTVILSIKASPEDFIISSFDVIFRGYMPNFEDIVIQGEDMYRLFTYFEAIPVQQLIKNTTNNTSLWEFKRSLESIGAKDDYFNY